MGNKQKYWQPFLDKISTHEVGDIIVISDWWVDKLAGASYTTIRYYLSLLKGIGYLKPYGIGKLIVIKKIPNTLRY